MSETEKLNIRPTTSVYATYQRLSYEHTSAIAEFVDNSTQSYFEHRDELRALDDFSELSVQIEYFGGSDEDARLTINDNAYGMDIVDFKRAIILDSRPSDTSGRNEFGMGLKTAACWYGKLWRVESTRLGSTKLYRAEVDVEKLARDGDEEIEIHIEETDPESHYTTITIERLHNKISGGRTVDKLKRLLASTYRVDLRTREIELSYNGDILTFPEIPVYSETLEDGSKKRWKKKISFEIEHEGQILPVNGFVAIRETINPKDAGFTLLRRGRVIIGGDNQNYHPPDLLPDRYSSQRIFGELNMDSWPVTQAKDDFDWHNSGLEEKFIEALSKNIHDFWAKADTIRSKPKKTSIEAKSVVASVAKELGSTGAIKAGRVREVPSSTPVSQSTPATPNKAPQQSGLILEGNDTWAIPLTMDGKQYLFNIRLIQEEKSSWFTSKKQPEIEKGKLEYTLTLNLSHKFFEPIASDINAISSVTQLIMSLLIAEESAASLSADGKIDPTSIRLRMRKILDTIGASGDKNGSK